MDEEGRLELYRQERCPLQPEAVDFGPSTIGQLPDAGAKIANIAPRAPSNGVFGCSAGGERPGQGSAWLWASLVALAIVVVRRRKSGPWASQR
ncbi:MAG: hypothetical protein EXR79_16135 [Myxococcales bacterium]|nr:hypothetical protein [Myxococcales bacterium]